MREARQSPGPGQAAWDAPHLRSSSKAARKGHGFGIVCRLLLTKRLGGGHCLPLGVGSSPLLGAREPQAMLVGAAAFGCVGLG